MNDTEEKRKKDQEPSSTPSKDSAFEEAVERVYRKYGSDLDAFVKDIQKDIQKRAATENAPSRRAFLV